LTGLSSIAQQGASPSRLTRTRRRAARRRRGLLLPILLLVALTLVAVAFALYWGARELNESQARAQESLVSASLDARREAFRDLVVDYAWWDEVIYVLDVGLDERWAREELGHYLLEAFGVTGIWVLGSEDQTKIAFVEGAPSEVGLFERLPGTVRSLLAAARQGRSIEAVPPVSFVAVEGRLHMVGASIISPFAEVGDPPGAESASLLVFMRPLDQDFFHSPSLESFLEDAGFAEGPAAEGYLDLEIMGVDGQAIGCIFWRNQRPGDDLLWSVAPLLFGALLILAFLLVLAVRRVDAVVSHEGRLSVSLDHERQRREDKSRFVSMVSHELRTPLQAVGAAADALDRYGEHMDRAEMREEIETIRRGVDALAGLVDDVLLIGKVDGEGKVQSIDLAHLCSAVWREVSTALKADQELRLSDRIGAPIESGAQVMLHTVLSNLLQNAVKYAPEGKAVEVDLAKGQGRYEISVRDFGPGIRREDREAVFEPYWRADRVLGTSGAGLGLSVARAAARSIGGDLTIESDGLDRGTRFVLRWPF